MKSSLNNKKIHALCLMVLLALSVSGLTFAAPVTQPGYEQLNTRFNTIAGEFQQQLAQSRARSLPKNDTITQLEFNSRKYLGQGDTINAVNLVLLNRELIKNNLHDNSVLFFLSLLLDNNQLIAAADLFNQIKQDGEKSLKSNASYLFALYYFHERKWKECLQYIDDTYADLPDEHANFARLITGVSLQHLKDHRKAIGFYERITNTSEYYLYARLNIAVAYIRQGWWTDAQNAINNALKPGSYIANQQNNEVINRLYLVLGYSLLQKEYYRDAREAFRNIATDSQYSNRALLGIALASANQEDFVGALNALSSLKDKASTDLSVDETYLLFPFIYRKLGQELTATTSYNEAMKYYQMRIDNLDKPYNSALHGLSNIKQTHDHYELVINDNLFEPGKNWPDSFLKNPDRITALLKSGNALTTPVQRKLIGKLSELQVDYKSAYKTAEKNIISQRKEHLNSYLNQSRYGLANLFDNSLSDSQ